MKAVLNRLKNTKTASGREMMTFIRFTNVREIANPEPKEKLVKIIGPLNRFGIGKHLDKETAMQLV